MGIYYRYGNRKIRGDYDLEVGEHKQRLENTWNALSFEKHKTRRNDGGIIYKNSRTCSFT